MRDRVTVDELGASHGGQAASKADHRPAKGRRPELKHFKRTIEVLGEVNICSGSEFLSTRHGNEKDRASFFALLVVLLGFILDLRILAITWLLCSDDLQLGEITISLGSLEYLETHCGVALDALRLALDLSVKLSEMLQGPTTLLGDEGSFEKSISEGSRDSDRLYLLVIVFGLIPDVMGRLGHSLEVLWLELSNDCEYKLLIDPVMSRRLVR